ncbi:hypothetical protein [Pectinatus frisingensis]|uniref:hypothetical protein n=1 Tax=Pectinatus frisingensis TaxID=865 RepID=UPI0018C4D55D|nr:hypothetical protein [Pectinatus frisingensis]
MSFIISNWLYFSGIIFWSTIFTAIVIYMIGIFLFALFGKFNIMKKIPMIMHIGHVAIINIIIAGVYIYTLPEKSVSVEYGKQIVRFINYNKLTTVDSIELFALYAVTVMAVLWVLMKIKSRKSIPGIKPFFCFKEFPEKMVYDMAGKGYLYNILITREKGAKTKLFIIDMDLNVLFKTTILGNGYSFYFANTRDNKSDLIYYFIDGSGGFLNDFKIIGEKDNKVQELFDVSSISKGAFSNIAKGCQMKIYKSQSDNLVHIDLISDNRIGISIYWNGGKYVYKCLGFN